MNRSFSKIRHIQEANLRLEKQFIKESSDNVQNKIIQTISSLKSVDDVNNYFDKLNNTYAPNSSKLVLIFPGYGQYSIVASTIYLSGINAQVFTSVNDCIKVLNDLAKQGKKYNQIYVGSHGGGTRGLLSSIDEGNTPSLDGLIQALNGVKSPGKTNIVFSACGGADSRYALKWVADQMGENTYGSEGAYDWIANTSENGFWMCPPKPELFTKGVNKLNNWFCKRVDSVPFSWTSPPKVPSSSDIKSIRPALPSNIDLKSISSKI